MGMRERAAHHEAGHLVAYQRYGIPVSSVEIGELAGDWEGFTSLPFFLPADVLQRLALGSSAILRTGDDINRVTRDNFESRAVVCWAGSIAERAFVQNRHVKRPHWLDLAANYGGWKDIVQSDNWAESLDIHGWQTRTRGAAVELVRENWAEIQAWAGRLADELRIDLIRLDPREV
jgi:hypothetical protein